MKKRRPVVMLMVATMVFSFVMAGCSSKGTSSGMETDESSQETPGATDSASKDSASSEDASSTAGGTNKVAFLINSSSDEYLLYMQKIFERDQADYGLEFVIFDAQGDSQTQAGQVSNAIAQGCEAIVINPNDAKGLGPAVKEAFEAGVHVITTVGDIAEEYTQYRESFVGPDDHEAGQLAADMMLEHFADGGDIVIVEGMAGYDAQIKRHDAFFEAIEGSKLNVLDYQSLPAWDASDALAVTEDFIVKYGDKMQGLFCHWDYGMVGVIEALDAAGITDDLYLVSIDGCKSGFQMVKDGKINATIAQDVEAIALASMETLRTVLDGDTVDQQVNPPLHVITLENIDDYAWPEW